MSHQKGVFVHGVSAMNICSDLGRFRGVIGYFYKKINIDSNRVRERGALVGVDQEEYAERYCAEAIGRA